MPSFPSYLLYQISGTNLTILNVLKEFRGRYKCQALDYNEMDETVFEVKYSPLLNEPAVEGRIQIVIIIISVIG